MTEAVATNHISTRATPEAVFAVLSDPFKYGDWVIGARKVLEADPSWPAVGTRFEHSLGAGPVELQDCTQVTECDPPSHLALRASFRPAGVARVDLRIEHHRGRTRISMREWPVDGPVHKLRGRLLDAATHARNVFALRRLRRLSELAASG